MVTWLKMAMETLTDLPARRWVEGLLLALIVSGLTAMFYRRLRTEKTDVVAMLTAMVLCGNVVLMVGVATFYRQQAIDTRYGFRAPFVPMPPSADDRTRRITLAERIMRAADLDRDGRLSPEEASNAAEVFVRGTNPAASGSVGVPEITDALRINTGGRDPRR